MNSGFVLYIYNIKSGSSACIIPEIMTLQQYIFTFIQIFDTGCQVFDLASYNVVKGDIIL